MRTVSLDEAHRTMRRKMTFGLKADVERMRPYLDDDERIQLLAVANFPDGAKIGLLAATTKRVLYVRDDFGDPDNAFLSVSFEQVKQVNSKKRWADWDLWITPQAGRTMEFKSMRREDVEDFVAALTASVGSTTT